MLPTERLDSRPPIIRFLYRLHLKWRSMKTSLKTYLRYMTHFKCPHVWGEGREVVDEENYFKTCIYCGKRKNIKEFRWEDDRLD